eukprot:Blabericola_migrator_1__524@NODE_1129_length_5339_cov_2973_663126_g723_i1_p4_GENE_NODE_1129_length_5339_cov_2973_663126_g723_i1NODE_1129_length_5339_cov_2973_663126_g723_i1_p4_ORF_typecomplete_len181_score13_64_NODE_1129_length_5339_cov_2973_663126_g723_i143914933
MNCENFLFYHHSLSLSQTPTCIYNHYFNMSNSPVSSAWNTLSSALQQRVIVNKPIVLKAPGEIDFTLDEGCQKTARDIHERLRLVTNQEAFRTLMKWAYDKTYLNFEDCLFLTMIFTKYGSKAVSNALFKGQRIYPSRQVFNPRGTHRQSGGFRPTGFRNNSNGCHLNPQSLSKNGQRPF